MNETGAVKFQFEIDAQELAPFAGFKELNAARRTLRCLGLIGVDQNGIGFGNVSRRDEKGETFHVTGSGTGGREELGLKDYAKVVSWDFARHWLRCQGSVTASAESLTHAAIYETDADIGAVVHGHDRELWLDLIKRGLTTSANVAYGTPEMAREVRRLFRETEIGAKRIFAMAGHPDGIVVFGSDLGEALRTLTTELERTRQDLED